MNTEAGNSQETPKSEQILYPCDRCGKDTGGEIWDLCPKCLDMTNYAFRTKRYWKAFEDGYEPDSDDFSEFEDEYSLHYLTPEERHEALQIEV